MPQLCRARVLTMNATGLQGDAAWLLAESVPAEELYDTATDPHQLRNLAGLAAHRAVTA